METRNRRLSHGISHKPGGYAFTAKPFGRLDSGGTNLLQRRDFIHELVCARR